MEALGIRARELDGARVLELRGQLDVGTAPQLRERLQAEQSRPRRLVLDLEGLEFLDSFGLGVLAGALKRARAGGGGLVVARASVRIREVLAMAGLETALAPAATVEEAARRPDAGE